MEDTITKVFTSNYYQEVEKIASLLPEYNNVSIDTEFPKLLRRTPRMNSDDISRYEDVKYNVSRSILFQVGITLTNDQGEVAGTWQFHVYDQDRMDELTNEIGITFGYVPIEGIPVGVFGFGFGQMLKCFYGKVKWITFHGLYDIAHLITIVTGNHLPSSLDEFTQLIGIHFGRVYDLKWMTYPADSEILRYNTKLLTFLIRRFGNREFIGLQKLADTIGITREEGRAHQAGSDSLLTANVFSELGGFYRTLLSDLSGIEGYLHGISSHRIHLCQPQVGHAHLYPRMTSSCTVGLPWINSYGPQHFVAIRHHLPILIPMR